MDKYIDVFAASDIAFAFLTKPSLENPGIPVQIANENLQGACCVVVLKPPVEQLSTGTLELRSSDNAKPLQRRNYVRLHVAPSSIPSLVKEHTSFLHHQDIE